MIERKVSIDSLSSFLRELSEFFKDKDAVYRVSIKQYREARSISQNSMYWAWLAEINKQAPLKCDSKINGSELWHEVFKKYYCPVKSISNDKAEIKIQSTKMLDVGEFTFYLNKIESWCMDRGIKLTIPDESSYAKLTNLQVL